MHLGTMLVLLLMKRIALGRCCNCSDPDQSLVNGDMTSEVISVN